MQIGLLITARCNAACTHCATSCGPGRTEALPETRIIEIMDEAAELTADGEELVFSISGGEAFLDFPKLLRIVKHGAGLGGRVTCVTNGYWASSDERARTLLESLKESGLSSIGISTSQFHQRYVKLHRAQRALTTAARLGITTVLKVAYTRQDKPEAEHLRAWAQAAGVTRVEIFPVLPYVRDGADLPEGDYAREEGLPEGVCPIPTLTLREDGTAYSCCAPGGFTEFLSLGNVFDQGLRHTHRKFLLNGKQRLLRDLGPIHFARLIEAQGLGHLLRKSYAGVCDLCAHIASDPRLSEVAETAAFDHELEFLGAALRRIASGLPRDTPPHPQGSSSVTGALQGESHGNA
jgi:MoaA/NifB/PqqE/SkfB family radical SAM enzyme